MILGTYINMPIKDVAASRAFFSNLGFSFNEQFCGEAALAMNLNENSAAMLLQDDFFKTFIPNPISDAHKSTEVLVAIQLSDKAAVDAMAEKAISLGGKLVRDPQDMGFMYSQSFRDLDGHIWEPFWMQATQ